MTVSKRKDLPDDVDDVQTETDDEVREQVEEHLRLQASTIYQIVRQEGMEELVRPLSSLCWSGIAAGLAIGFSVISQAVLRAYLPEAAWSPLVESWGYSIGFLIVVLSRMQLFTENTITVILPLIAKPTAYHFLCVGRLWGVVFAANMVGCFLFALFVQYSGALTPEVYAATLDISRDMMAYTWPEMFLKGIFAGWLIAAMVWILPSAKGSEVLVILILTTLIAVGSFTHIIAGSVEGFLLVLADGLSPVTMFVDFTIPVFLGNVTGGTALFALIAYAQVSEEL